MKVGLYNIDIFFNLQICTSSEKMIHVILDVEENYAIKLTLAILGPMVGFCIITGILLFYLLVCRTRRKRTLAAGRNKLVIDSEMEPSILHFSFSSPTSTTMNHSHELRATAAGDSTLKVQNKMMHFDNFQPHNTYLECCIKTGVLRWKKFNKWFRFRFTIISSKNFG